MVQDNLRHAQYGADGTQIDDPQALFPSVKRNSTSGAPQTAMAINAKLAKPRILFIGDSITDYGSYYQSITISTSVTPYGGGAFSIMSISWACGSGNTGTLFFNKVAQTLRWTASGDTPGAVTDVSLAGVYTLKSGTPTKTLTIVCRPRGYAASTDGAFSVTTTATTESSRRSGKTYAYWAHAKSCAGFEVQLLANAGSQIRDVTESAGWQIEADYYDAIFCLVGTNDIASDRTYAQITTDYTNLLNVLKTKTKRVHLMTILSRSASMTATRRQILAASNKWIMSLFNYGVTPVNGYTRITDPASANGDPVAEALDVDGLHTAIPGAEAVGEAAYLSLADAFTFDPTPVASSQTDTYDVTNNPYGNRLPVGGTFSGTGGTAGAGASGVLPTGWTVARSSGADLLIVGSQIARTDGFPGNMQRFVITNPGATSQSAQINPTTLSAVAAGQVWKTQGACVIAAMSGCEQITLGIEPASMGGAFISSWGANSIATKTMAGAKRKMVMEPWPLTIPTGAALATIYLRATLAAGGSITIDCLPGEWTFWRES